MFHKLFPSRTRLPPALPPGRRVYAIGDIHGRADLLDALLAMIDDDIAARAPAQVTMILLGDLIDRGPDSAGVVERVRTLMTTHDDVRLLMGNHEEVFLATLDGDLRAARLFCRIGGRETALSYGISADQFERFDHDELIARLARLVPARHRALLSAAPDMATVGDYAFVHAGVRPSIALDAQVPGDLRWIRAGFLDHRAPLERMIVHGHTVVPAIEHRPHRIGIDTGAYATGRLTALALEGTEQWSLATG